MKEWTNPQLLSLGVDMTMAPKEHDGYCHASNGPCTGKVNDHSASGNKGHTFTGNICKEHYVTTGAPGNNGNYACCCYSSLNEEPPLFAPRPPSTFMS